MSIEKVEYLEQPNCLRIANGDAELIVSTDVGPRVLHYAFAGQPNIFGLYPSKVTKGPLGEWKPYGGQRLWAGPENLRTTYAPDNSAIAFASEGEFAVRLDQPVDAAGLRKSMRVELAPHGSDVRMLYSITSENGWTVVLHPWSIAVFTGGLSLLPREPYCSHDECLAAAQPLTLWPFTDLEDPRLALGERYIAVRPNRAVASAQKIGLQNRQCWCGYHRENTLFLKRFEFEAAANYPDYGANNEAYTAGDYMELELLGPLRELATGETVNFQEHWRLESEIALGETEDAIQKAIAPALHRFMAP